MNHEIYSLAKQMIGLIDSDRKFRDETKIYGDWYDHLVDHCIDYEDYKLLTDKP